jgi:hypothetical protein
MKIIIEHTSMTEPFGDMVDHLQDCCGGCPYCVQLCQQVVDEAEAIGKRAENGDSPK